MKKKNPLRKSASKNPLPEISFVYLSRSKSCDWKRFETIVRAGLPHCLNEASKHHGSLPGLTSIEIVVAGRRRMAAVHREFLQIRGATDVITFPTGEILVCPDVAIERAGEFGNEPTVELALYAIHGFLHLAGLDDLTPRDAGLMAQVQERILKSSL